MKFYQWMLIVHVECGRAILASTRRRERRGLANFFVTLKAKTCFVQSMCLFYVSTCES